jgi:predicted ATPase
MWLMKRRELHEGLRTLRIVLKLGEDSGWTLYYPEVLGAFAEGLAELGQLEEALKFLARALAFTEMGGECWYAPELLRLRGELLLRRGDEDSATAAELSFQRAIEMAQGQGALLWELRAALSLGRHWQRSKRILQAKRVLEPVCARFSEGFATADLRAAKDFLELA